MRSRERQPENISTEKRVMVGGWRGNSLCPGCSLWRWNPCSERKEAPGETSPHRVNNNTSLKNTGGRGQSAEIVWKHSGEGKEWADKRRRGARKSGECMHKQNPINPIDSTVLSALLFTPSDCETRATTEPMNEMAFLKWSFKVNFLCYCKLISFCPSSKCWTSCSNDRLISYLSCYFVDIHRKLHETSVVNLFNIHPLSKEPWWKLCVYNDSRCTCRGNPTQKREEAELWGPFYFSEWADRL